MSEPAHLNVNRAVAVVLEHNGSEALPGRVQRQHGGSDHQPLRKSVTSTEPTEKKPT